MPPLLAFQAFVAAAELGSFSRAADHLCRTQGAVSRQVQQLEAHYRCALFVRHASGLTLTPEGNALRAVVDAMVVRGPGSWAGMDAIPLFEENLAPLCTRELAASLQSVADLRRVTLLHPAHDREEWRCWLDHVGAASIDANRGLQFDTLELTLTAAAQGHGVAIGDPRMARDRLEAGALVMPFRDIAQNGLGYFLVYPSARAAQPKIRALAGILTRLAREARSMPA
ncbi:LysR substrate-binding domain-containing protein [Burkholderia stagnalis]